MQQVAMCHASAEGLGTHKDLKEPYSQENG